MPMEQISIAAATAILKYDLLQDSEFRQSDRPRRIVAAGLAGSAAALDSTVELLIGRTKAARLFNTKTGSPNRDDMMRVGDILPANSELHAIVTDAPATNPLNLFIDFEE